MERERIKKGGFFCGNIECENEMKHSFGTFRERETIDG